MHVVQVIDAKLPVRNYGGTERVAWGLSRALAEAGHRVTLLAQAGTRADFAHTIARDPDRAINEQLPPATDVVHFHDRVQATEAPFLVTQHGNVMGTPDRQSVFVSRRHAHNHGSESWVHNGLDWSAYPPLRTGVDRRFFHFLGKASWRVKNLSGAVRTTRLAGEQLVVLGGRRLSLKMGARLTLGRHVSFRGMVNDVNKVQVMSRSRGLVFPVTWHEPFGLAVIESLYCGCPVFGTPYGALPELVTEDYGVLADSAEVLVAGLHRWREFDPHACHEYARDQFNANRMARDYLERYRRVAAGEFLNPSLPENVDRFRDLSWDQGSRNRALGTGHDRPHA